MKIVTSVTIFNDAVGKRMSVSYSTIDENTGKITSDNNRIDRLITDNDAKQVAEQLTQYAQQFVDISE